MSKALNDVMGAAKDSVESVKDATEHAFGSAKEATEHAIGSAKSGIASAKKETKHTFTSVVTALASGVSAVAGLTSTLRKLDADHGLAWFGLARRRSPLLDVALFGSGMAVGAGIGVLFAPMAGAELRGKILERFKGLETESDAPAPAADAKSVADKPVERSVAEKEAPKRVDVGGSTKHVS
jgi:gas vesicle protein